MKLVDSCVCGSQFGIKILNRGQAMIAWGSWLNVHAPCRGDERTSEVVKWTPLEDT